MRMSFATDGDDRCATVDVTFPGYHHSSHVVAYCVPNQLAFVTPCRFNFGLQGAIPASQRKKGREACTLSTPISDTPG
jgi:hypothetical protein